MNAVDAALCPPVTRQPLAQSTASEATEATERLQQNRGERAFSTTNQPLVAGSKPSIKRRRKSNPWLIPALAGCGFLVLLLGALKISGILQIDQSPSSSDKLAGRPSSYPSGTSGSNGTAVAQSSDPRDEFYQIVDSGESLLWAPPAAPAPLPMSLLPPGGQLFVSFRPADLMAENKSGRRLLATFDQQLSPLLERVSTITGCGLEEIAQITAVFHPPLI